jgi:HEAT repeat protein
MQRSRPIEALKDKKEYVRSSAASALGQIGPGAANAVPALIEALKDKDLEVRASAAFTLRTFGSRA